MLKVSLRDKNTGKQLGVLSGSEAAVNARIARLGENVEVSAEIEPEPPKQLSVRNLRNGLLDRYAWTVRVDSPLTFDNQIEWMQYLRALHRINKDHPRFEDVTWPTPPKLVYADE